MSREGGGGAEGLGLGLELGRGLGHESVVIAPGLIRGPAPQHPIEVLDYYRPSTEEGSEAGPHLVSASTPKQQAEHN